MLYFNAVPTNNFLTIYKLVRLLLLMVVIFTKTTVHIYAQENAQNRGKARMHASSQMAFHGDFTNTGFFQHNKGTAYFYGKRLQNILGTNEIDFQNLTLVNSKGVVLHIPVVVTENLTFEKGLLYTKRETPSVNIVFEKGAPTGKVADEGFVL